MPHIHTEPGQHDHTVSAYIIRTDLAEPKIMLHMHKKLKRWMQFGGHVELDENPWQAISHELKEETGYDMSQLKILQPRERVNKTSGSKLHPVPATYITHPFGDIPHSHTDIGYIFVTDQAPKNQIDSGESPDIKLYGLKELGSIESFPDVLEISRFAIETALPKWEVVDTSIFD